MLDNLQRFKEYKRLNPNELSHQQFDKLEAAIRHPDSKLIPDEHIDFLLWCLHCPSRQESFASFIANKLSNNKGAKILEVGGGKTGRLSRFLSEKGFNMTCIDPKLELRSSTNIEFIRGKFDYRRFDISPYDYVIGQEPCDATEHIVRACIRDHVPFLISLCGVPHKLIFGKKPRKAKDWYDYLINLSSEEITLEYVELDPIVSTPILRSNQF